MATRFLERITGGGSSSGGDKAAATGEQVTHPQPAPMEPASTLAAVPGARIVEPGVIPPEEAGRSPAVHTSALLGGEPLLDVECTDWRNMRLFADRIELHGRFMHRTYRFEDIIGAKAVPGTPNQIEICVLTESRASRARKITDTIEMEVNKERVTLADVEGSLELVTRIRHIAACPNVEPGRSKHVAVVLNPHGGRGTAVEEFEARLQPLLEFGGIQFTVFKTQYAGHAIDMGKEYDPDMFEGAILIGGDGTIQEFMSGLVSRPDWAMLLRRVPVCTIKYGTTNAIASGVRTAQMEYAAYCIIKRKLRPLDAMLVLNAAGLRTVSMCVSGWGMASMVALDSETTRSSIGVYRYTVSKGVHAIQIALGNERFSGQVEYSADLPLSDPEIATFLACPETMVSGPEGGDKGHDPATVSSDYTEVTPVLGAAGGDAQPVVLHPSAAAINLYTRTRVADVISRVKTCLKPGNGRGMRVHDGHTFEYPGDSLLGVMGGTQRPIELSDSITRGKLRHGSGLVNLRVPPAKIVEAYGITVESVQEASVHDPTAKPLVMAASASTSAGDAAEPDLTDMVTESAAVRDAVWKQAISIGKDVVCVDEADMLETPSVEVLEELSKKGFLQTAIATAVDDPDEYKPLDLRGDHRWAITKCEAKATDLLNQSTVRAVAMARKLKWRNGGFGDLVMCERNCKICRERGRLRFVGHRTKEVVFDSTLPTTGGASMARPRMEVAHETKEALTAAHGATSTRSPAAGAGVGACGEDTVDELSSSASGMASSAGVASDSSTSMSTASSEGVAGLVSPSALAGHRKLDGTEFGLPVWAIAPTNADLSTNNYTEPIGMSVTSRGFLKRKEGGEYLAVVAINLAAEAKYHHASDGYVDLFIVRVGSATASLDLLRRYVAQMGNAGDIYHNDLVDYLKVRSIVITPDKGQEQTVLNVDGEAFPGPGPFRLHLLPSLITTYGTY